MNLIVALGKNREIGINGQMPWHLPEDLRHFKQTTLHHPVIMGRRTWLSIPGAPLPGRINAVLSTNTGFHPEGALVFQSLRQALTHFQTDSPPSPAAPFIIGGATLYKEALPLCNQLFITEINAEYPDADTYFPEIDPALFSLSESTPWQTSRTGLQYRFLTYTKK